MRINVQDSTHPPAPPNESVVATTDIVVKDQPSSNGESMEMKEARGVSFSIGAEQHDSPPPQRPVELGLLSPNISDVVSPSNVYSTTETTSSLGPYLQQTQLETINRIRSRSQKRSKAQRSASIIINPTAAAYTHTIKAGVEKFLSRHIDDLFEKGKVDPESEISSIDDVDFVFVVRKGHSRSLSFRCANWLSGVIGREKITEEDIENARERYLQGLKQYYKVSYRKIETKSHDFYPIKLSFYHLGLMMQLVGYQWRIRTTNEDKVAYKTFYFMKRDVERFHEYHNCRSRADFSARWRYDLTYNFLVGANIPVSAVNPWRTLFKRNSQTSLNLPPPPTGEDLERSNSVAREKEYSLLHLFADEIFDDWIVPHSLLDERPVEEAKQVIEEILESGTRGEKCCTTCCFPCWTCQCGAVKKNQLSVDYEDHECSACGTEFCDSWRSFFFRNSVDCMDAAQRPNESRICTVRNAVTKHSFPSPPEEESAKIKHILPLKTLVDYLGEKVGFYFGWVELLILSLTVPSIIGTAMFICGVCYYAWALLWDNTEEDPTDPAQWVLAKACDNYATPAFSACMVVWGTAFYEIWQRRERWYAFMWRVEKLENTELERPPAYTFKSTARLKKSKIFRPVLYLPSFIITLFFIILVFASVYFINVVGVFSIPYCPKMRTHAPHTAMQNSSNVTVASTTTSKPTFALSTTIPFNYTAIMLSNKTATPKPEDDKVDKFICNLFSAAQVIANSLSMFILDFLYTRICYLLTDWEGHKTQSTYTNALVIKLFTFRFFNYYSVLFFIAFGIAAKTVQYPDELTGGTHYKYEDFGCGEQPCMAMLSRQLLSVIVTQPLINSLYDVIVPGFKLIYYAIKQRTSPDTDDEPSMKRGESNGGTENGEYDTASAVYGISRANSTTSSRFDHSPLASELVNQAHLTQLSTLDRREFTTEEYTEKVIVYGALLMFSVALPPAPALALLIMRIDLNLDIGRIMTEFRRPIPLRSQDIGMWGPIVNFLTYLGIITNPLIVILTSSWGSPMPNSYKFLIFIIFEHIVFAIRMLVSFAVPDVPKDLVREQLIHKATKDELQSILLDAKIEQAGAKTKRQMIAQATSSVGSASKYSKKGKGNKLASIVENLIEKTAHEESKT